MINILKTIDLAVLKPNRLEDDLIQACKLANTYKVASVCVRPMDVLFTKELLCNSIILVSTVIGFPRGNQNTNTKIMEALQAIEDGGNELDVVMDTDAFLNKKYSYVRDSLKMLVKTAKDTSVKVIIETGLLSPDKIIKASQLVEASGAAYVKTCTGYGPRGVVTADISTIMSSTSLPVKASGGIKTYNQASAYVALGCQRLGIGLESFENILKELNDASK